MIKFIARFFLGALVVCAFLYGAYTGLNFIDDIQPFGRMWETPAIWPHERPVPAMAQGVVPFSGGEAMLRAGLKEGLIIPPYVNVTDEIVASGKRLYSYYCIHCHGKFFDGKGTVGQSFSPLPTDIRSPEVQQMTATELFKNLSYGTPNGRQPALATTIAPEDRWHLVSFIQSLGTRHRPQGQLPDQGSTTVHLSSFP